MASVLICGGGNAAQVCSCLFASRYRVTALALYADEAERWNKAVQETGFMECTLEPENKAIKATPDLITKDPRAVRDCDVVLFTVPSSYHEQYFSALAPYVKDGTVFAVMPARSGCDFLFNQVMGEKASKLGLVAFETLPWQCRFKEWGKTSVVKSTKETIGAAVVPPASKSATEVVLKLQGLLGVEPMIIQCPNVMSISLGNPGQVVHPGITYGRWWDWDGEPLAERPLFYHGVDEFSAGILSSISKEIQAICQKLKSINPSYDTSQVKTIFEWYMASYSHSCSDISTLQKVIVTNAAYNGFFHPMKVNEDSSYTPDFQFRYLSEDVPTGLCFTKGVADLLDVKTPTIDKVVTWSQEKLGKEFITLDGRMAGKDLGQTRAPQAWGIKTKKDLLEFLDLKPMLSPFVPIATVAIAAVAAILVAGLRRTFKLPS
mmetsp:Transcript_120646/g.303339  ORF Transcript_120646/g.303339 Transcript_120646/m.303339 type:complete len:433 (-) Transcript_120646:80-1378(-)